MNKIESLYREVFKLEEVYISDKGIITARRPSGFTGARRLYYENGHRASESYYKDGEYHGTCRTWNANGQLFSETEWKEDQLHGLDRLWYHDNEQLAYEFNFKYGKRDGMARQWYRDGALKSKNIYKDGKRIKEFKY